MVEARPPFKPNNIRLLEPFVGKKKGTSLLKHFTSLNAIARATSDHQHEALEFLSPTQKKRLRSAFELGSALVKEKIPMQPCIRSAQDIANVVREDFRFAANEQVRALFLDSNKQLISCHLIAQGSANAVTIEPRDIFKIALREDAYSIALTHNHPGGFTAPSKADVKLTEQFVAVGRLLKIPVVDHVIMGQPSEFSNNDYSSLRSLNLVQFD